MGQTATRIVNHPSPIDHRGNLTKYARTAPLKKKIKPENKTEHGPSYENKAIGLEDVADIVPDNDEQTLGTIVSNLVLAVLAIVTALTLQKTIDYGFELLMPSGARAWKLLSLFLQFVLVFTFLVFFAFLFAG